MTTKINELREKAETVRSLQCAMCTVGCWSLEFGCWMLDVGHCRCPWSYAIPWQQKTKNFDLWPGHKLHL